MTCRSATAALLIGSAALLTPQTTQWQRSFPVDRQYLGVKGSNPCFNLTPGYRLSFRLGTTTDTLLVLPEAKLIDGVQTRVVEDRETVDGKLVELTRDYYAIDARTNAVYYFGEDVDV